VAWVAFAALLAMGSCIVVMTLESGPTLDHRVTAIRSSGLALEPLQGFLQGAHRWFTASWVHWGAPHLLLNLLGTALVAWFGWAAQVRRAEAMAWVAAWPLSLVLLMLLFWVAPFDLTLPTHLGGLSGVLHAGVAVAAMGLATSGHWSRRRWVGVAVLVGLGIKLALELGSGPAHWSPGVRTEPWLHVGGALAGLICAAVAQLVRRSRGPRLA
jgi:hypothetical protein